MMKHLFLFIFALCFLSACENDEPAGDTSVTVDTVATETIDTGEKENIYETPKPTETFANKAFRKVRVARKDENTFVIKGEARVYEANVQYVVEDGHYQLVDSFTTASTAAPEWGTFNFRVSSEREEPQTSLMLILFETDAATGQRKNELIIPLSVQRTPI